MTKNSRLYISDTLAPAEAATVDYPRHRSVIVAIVCDEAPAKQLIDDQLQVARDALGTPVLDAGIAVISGTAQIEHLLSADQGIQLLPHRGQWREVKISEWDVLHGPHAIDLVDVPSHGETALLVRVCGISPLGPR